ncbi:hypothetical protein Pmani_015654 [Petrolisthes manimaculis]|uniref:GDNF/GAS1 domain-containing protein n=1 Tax=Petrolisthes manimaculis TaxID=1843537 RepID=A0AAE1PTE1_9EUCA|nr:hypothetical protein Pmani_015654 [Petrolisthes manimaculis]
MAEERCRRLLTPVLDSCNNRCNRKECMTNLQIFYRNVDDKWANEVAFCLCKKSSTTANECLMAQEKLHPPCARQPAGSAPMLCNRLAAACKEDNDGGCRPRLEFYEQACAVDSNTRRCAGSTSECRRAVLLILGTQLRNLCTCVASDPRETFTCLDWQRILWFNPCVVESQMNYHRDMLAAMNPGEEVTTASNIILPSPTHINSKPVLNGVGGGSSFKYPNPGVNIDPGATPGSVIITPLYTNKHPYPMQPTRAPYTTSTTTTAVPITTLPPKYCKKTLNSNYTIEEGGGRRYYNKGEDCSSLCLCHDHEKQVACSVLGCIEPSPCETNYATYTHAAPAYQAARGECFCYSGSFICVRPPKGTYNINYGVYLFLGYSKEEERLMLPYTKVNLVDVAKNKLADLVREAALFNNMSECRLEEVLHVGENIIMQATLDEFADSRDNMSAAMLHKEKESCKAVLTDLVQKINRQDKEVREDMALSVLILAQVQVHIPPLPDSAVLISVSPYLLLITTYVSLHNGLLAS